MRDDRFTTATVYAVAVCTAVASFRFLYDLARLVGWGNYSFALPVSVDIYALGATRIWLDPAEKRASVRRWAMWSSWLGIVVSSIGNAVDHLLRHPAGQPIGVAVAVGVVPPVMYGVVVHLHALRHYAPEPGVPTTNAAPLAPEPREETVDEPRELRSVTALPVSRSPVPAGEVSMAARLRGLIDERIPIDDERSGYEIARSLMDELPGYHFATAKREAAKYLRSRRQGNEAAAP